VNEEETTETMNSSHTAEPLMSGKRTRDAGRAGLVGKRHPLAPDEWSRLKAEYRSRTQRREHRVPFVSE
jgi:hypothetical protein